MQNLWYKNAIIYSLDVETFMDANGDGVGDFQGLIERLDYLSGLGINCLWLLPFYPSPNRDNGYDVMDYYNIDPRLGTLGDFVEFMDQATERGIHVLIDLVVNHTSIKHPWFQAARKDKQSKYRDYYVWSENPPQDNVEEIVFPHAEDSIWEYDQQAEAYYLHHFYKEQPDLNIANPVVQEEIRKIINFWLQLGVSGFRVDAVPYLIKEIGVQAEGQELESFLKEMREFLSLRRADAILLAEANVEPDLTCVYFGQGDRMDMLFNFFLNQQMFLGLARQQANPIIHGLKSLPKIPRRGQWLNFVRHHDELNLNQLDNAQREEICQVFAPEEAMQIYGGRGIRRRLPPMFSGDRRRIELTYSLLFSFPGIPLLRYGDEIGMGDDLSLPDRDSVRTPMQWSSEPNGGFSTAPPENLTKPMISQGEYSYKSVNVAANQRDPNSLLNWMDRLIRIRKQCPEFGSGNWQMLETGETCVFAHSCELNNRIVIAVHNLADKSCSITLKLDGHYYLDDLFSDHQYEVAGESRTISLEAYGYRWFRLNPIKP